MRKSKHGARNHPLYKVWRSMIQRCHSKKNPRYADYGGRGITVCDEWRNDPWAFFASVGERPSESHTIERKDNDKGYSPGNVEWATRSKQNGNRRSVRRITANGRTLMMSEQDAVTTPVDSVKQKARREPRGQ